MDITRVIKGSFWDGALDFVFAVLCSSHFIGARENAEWKKDKRRKMGERDGKLLPSIFQWLQFPPCLCCYLSRNLVRFDGNRGCTRREYHALSFATPVNVLRAFSYSSCRRCRKVRCVPLLHEISLQVSSLQGFAGCCLENVMTW